MASRPDAMCERIEAYRFPRGGVEVVRAKGGYTLYSRRTCGTPAADRRQRSCAGAVVARDAWGAPGDFGPVIMPLDEALAFVASEGFFWIQA